MRLQAYRTRNLSSGASERDLGSVTANIKQHLLLAAYLPKSKALETRSFWDASEISLERKNILSSYEMIRARVKVVVMGLQGCANG